MDLRYIAYRSLTFTLAVLLMFALFHGASFIASAAGIG